MMHGCQHLCKYLSSPQEARRFISNDPSSDLNKGQPRTLSAMGNSNQGIPTDSSSFQQLLQLQAAGGLGNMLSSQLPRTQDSLSTSLALLSGQSSALNPSLQFLGNNMQNRSAIASYLELHLRQQHQQLQQQGSGGSSSGGGDGRLGGVSRGAQV